LHTWHYTFCEFLVKYCVIVEPFQKSGLSQPRYLLRCSREFLLHLSITSAMLRSLEAGLFHRLITGGGVFHRLIMVRFWNIRTVEVNAQYHCHRIMSIFHASFKSRTGMGGWKMVLADGQAHTKFCYIYIYILCLLQL